MVSRAKWDAIVVGSGPNGLAAAIHLARAGCSVQVREARDTIGGGMRSAELTLPGFVHDICSAIHPLGVASPFFRSLPLDDHGLEWVHPPAPLAHPLDDGTAVVLERSLEATVATLDRRDAAAYMKLMGPFVDHWGDLVAQMLGPLRVPHHPLLMARVGLLSVRSAKGLAEAWFAGERARALFAGLAAHSMLPLDRKPTAAFGLGLSLLGHAIGWPVARGGSQQLANALASYLQSCGGEIVVNAPVNSVDELPPSRAILFDVTPRQLLRIAGRRLPGGYRDSLARFRYGPGAFKIDWALDGPIPWTAEGCRRAGTVHVGGTFEEIAVSERTIWEGKAPERPYMIVAQQSLFDPTRAPNGKQTVWAYCHVPHGSTFDMTERMEAQIERFAPGFRERILARHVFSPLELEAYNPNYVGGDINGGVQDLGQFFTRPTMSLDPYSTPAKGIYLCSSSTPPGGGVHGMCGYHAAKAALKALQ